MEMGDQRTLVQTFLLGDGRLIDSGDIWRVKDKKIVRVMWDVALYSPVMFVDDHPCKYEGLISWKAFDPGFLVLKIEDSIRMNGTFVYLLTVLRLPRADDHVYLSKISFPGEITSASWTKEKYISTWTDYFEKIS